MEASVDPQPRGPDWMPITPKTGSLFHAETHLDRLNKKRRFFPIRFGYQAETDSDAIIDVNAEQVRNIPRDVTAIVIPVGSGVSARGVLEGTERYRPMVKVHLIQPFGYDRRLAIPEGLKTRYFMGAYDYAKPLKVTIDVFQLDEIYEAKAYDYMRRRLKRMLAKERVFLGHWECQWNEEIGQLTIINESDAGRLQVVAT